MTKSLKILKHKTAYIIVWRGRDSYTEVWDEYPLHNRGVFTNKLLAEKEKRLLEEIHPTKYDADAQEHEMFFIQEIPLDFITEGLIDRLFKKP